MKDVPEDVFEILINEQTRIKLDRGTGQFGLAQVIYRLIRAVNKLISMPRREYSFEHLCYFARYVHEKCATLSPNLQNNPPSLQTLRCLLEEWKRDRPNEYQEDRSMVTLLGKTPGDILGLNGPKPETPSGN